MQVDIYCERLGPGLWAEPLNAITNLAFAVAAVLVWRWSKRSPRSVRVLAPLIALIFVCSSVFHTVATSWAGALDSAGIAVYLLYYVTYFAHWYAGVPLRRSWLGAPIFVVFTVVTSVLGAGMYGAALLALAVLTGWLAYTRREWRYFAVATVVFALSLTLRTVDKSWCSAIPFGTHWAWHVLNAVVLATASLSAVKVTGRGGPTKP